MPPEASPKDSQKRSLKSTLFFVAKLGLAGGLIAWLVLSGRLDFAALKVLYQQPSLLAFDLGLFMLGACIGAFRYQTLLRIADVHISFAKMFQLQMTALFFNVVIPGNIGGDVVKALYVARDAAPEKRTTILLLAFVERILGLAALILVGGLVVGVRSSVWAHPLLRPFATVVLALAGAMIAGGVISLYLVRVLGARLDSYTSGPSKIAKLLNQLVASLRIISEGPKQIAISLAVSMLYHFGSIGFFMVVTNAILHADTTYASMATVVPIGLLSLLLPISPAGMGVGHYAFDELFKAIGIVGGATIFNVFALGQNTPCLFGVIPFLTLKRRGELPTEAA